MKRVLMLAGQMNMGGLENMVMNFIRYSDRENIHFDFMLNYPGEQYYSEEIRGFGSNIYVMPRLKPKNMLKYPLALIKFFREHRGEYDVLHGHLTSVGIFYLPIAKLFGKVKKTAVHAHYTSTEKNHYEKLERLMLFPLRFLADYYFACSDMAAEFCYGKNILKKKNYKLIHNGVDCDKFDYNPSVREELRKELGLEKSFTLLNVGRMEEQKNQRYLLRAAADMKAAGLDIKLLIAGDGSMRAELEGMVKDLNLSDTVYILGLRSDVDKLMQAADAFILTSLFEGLPVTGIEAQAAGLPCILADTITPELDIIGRTRFVPLDKGTDKWIDAVRAAMDIPRGSAAEKMRQSGYDIKAEAKWLSNFYKN